MLRILATSLILALATATFSPSPTPLPQGQNFLFRSCGSQTPLNLNITTNGTIVPGQMVNVTATIQGNDTALAIVRQISAIKYELFFNGQELYSGTKNVTQITAKIPPNAGGNSSYNSSYGTTTTAAMGTTTTAAMTPSGSVVATSAPAATTTTSASGVTTSASGVTTSASGATTTSSALPSNSSSGSSNSSLPISGSSSFSSMDPGTLITLVQMMLDGKEHIITQPIQVPKSLQPGSYYGAASGLNASNNEVVCYEFFATVQSSSSRLR